MVRDYRPIQSPKLQKEMQRPGYSYQEYAPCEKLAPHVACYWTLDYHAEAERQLHRIIPDGCVDIIVDRLSPSGWKSAFVAGLMTQFEVLSLSGPQSLFGIRFYTESAQSFLKFPVSAFLGHHVFLEEIWGAEGLYFAEEILAALTVTAVIHTVEKKLQQLLHAEAASSHPLVRTSLQVMYASKGVLSTSDLADQLSFSERHVRRTFDRELGVSPKEMLGIIRFQSMLQELYSSAVPSFTDMALKYGYYDQSHFIKSFKRYYGMLPKQIWTRQGDDRSRKKQDVRFFLF
ncbi:helix-turn-helix transcriptional regulator [Brevibacillus composti]|uniref:Helix-turn-helix transcriptional regulator n=1 Tax=Brevibacillus composti TaxID=2796470 RepID=A0A7T5JN45_9BACL|nr:helix-turn-helix transcriptional regulator [Brevibacillus composti]QQE73726.1 helix-turn-helix transcriptional regulator [Brevibacillus composti]QUO40809.1 helix-turn-helix transcriptional regulator [Brevibacillus composti]